ncbi:MAG: c-type cytochrome [bacterium]
MTALRTKLFLVALMATNAVADNASYVKFQGTHLAQGRAIWLENCEGCHGYGIAGAPVPMHPEEWQPRLKQPLAVLHQHAIDGFFGPDDTMMPPKGGNDNLSNPEVRAAVDYMAVLARYYIDTQEKSR